MGPLSLINKVDQLLRLDEPERLLEFYFAVGIVPYSENESQLIEFLNETIVHNPRIFFRCVYDHVEEDRWNFDYEIPWEVSELGEDAKSFEETFGLLGVDSYYYDQTGEGDARIFSNDNLLPGHTLFFVFMEKYQK